MEVPDEAYVGRCGSLRCGSFEIRTLGFFHAKVYRFEIKPMLHLYTIDEVDPESYIKDNDVKLGIGWEILTCDGIVCLA